MYTKGYIKQWRKEFESDIWAMPPLYHRVWSFLLSYVEWRPTIFPTQKNFGIHVNEGQKITSLNNIAKHVSWKEYGVTKTPNRKTISKILEWLEFNQMIALEGNTSGTYLSVCNWGKYQMPENEEVTSLGQPLGQPLGHINKKIKKLKKLKNNTIVHFDSFWKIYPRKINKKKCKAWWKTNVKDNEKAELIIAGLKKQMTIFSGKEVKFIPHPQTWLNGERWNDEIEPSQEKGKLTWM